MRHKYKKSTKPLDELTIKIDECIVCGCERHTLRYKAGIIYYRSGLDFDLAPACIDEKEEAKKTID